MVAKMLALPPNVLFPADAEPSKVLVDRRFVLRPAAGSIDVFDAHEQASTAFPRQIMIEQRRKSVTQMQIAVRARRKTKDTRVHRQFGYTPAQVDTGASHSNK